MAEIQWQEPPSDGLRGSRGRWKRIGDELRTRPGQWALVASSTSDLARQARLRGAFGPGTFETTSRANGDGTRDEYARFVGESA